MSTEDNMTVDERRKYMRRMKKRYVQGWRSQTRRGSASKRERKKRAKMRKSRLKKRKKGKRR
ncbi:MAG: hypothetical protein GTO63_08730 [Anaerolineae bacterium]|nr:hypothetical protein [Anaerolineae bacterium]NIN95584.1 hypothetical protein [Anaerolineae bacterium]NIQ79205.1 hypothetical protein [Anaerolineae bacterium]